MNHITKAIIRESVFSLVYMAMYSCLIVLTGRVGSLRYRKYTGKQPSPVLSFANEN